MIRSAFAWLGVVALLALADNLTQSLENEIPLSLAAKLNSISDTKQFLELVNDVGNYSDGSSGIERKAVLTPIPAGCKPENQTVKLRTNNDLSLHYFPSCTRIERCGGCCTKDNVLSCQPTESDLLNFKVAVYKYKGGKSLSLIGQEIVTVERHLKCRCDCIVKPSDCNARQRYDKGSCQCICTNSDEKKKCYEDDTNKKFWNPHNCTCDCLTVTECTSGYSFDKNSCSCEPEQRPRNRFSGVYSVNSRISNEDTIYTFLPTPTV